MHGNVRTFPHPPFVAWPYGGYRRVAELEQENAQLKALAQKGSSGSRVAPDETLAEIEQLRAKLAAAEQREQELSGELERKEPVAPDNAVKVEVESSASTRPTSPKSGACFGLMVSSNSCRLSIEY